MFEDRQVILTPDWLEKTVPLPEMGLRHLALRRPCTADLVLTKMMRVDPQDRDDVRFLMNQADVSRTEMQATLQRAIVPDVAEIRDAFEANRTWLQSWL